MTDRRKERLHATEMSKWVNLWSYQTCKKISYTENPSIVEHKQLPTPAIRNCGPREGRTKIREDLPKIIYKENFHNSNPNMT